MPKLVKMYNAVNFAVDINKLVYFEVVVLNTKVANLCWVQITFTSYVTYEVCVSVIEEAKTDYMTHNLSFPLLF